MLDIQRSADARRGVSGLSSSCPLSLSAFQVVISENQNISYYLFSKLLKCSQCHSLKIKIKNYSSSFFLIVEPSFNLSFLLWIRGSREWFPTFIILVFAHLSLLTSTTFFLFIFHFNVPVFLLYSFLFCEGLHC